MNILHAATIINLQYLFKSYLTRDNLLLFSVITVTIVSFPEFVFEALSLTGPLFVCQSNCAADCASGTACEADGQSADNCGDSMCEDDNGSSTPFLIQVHPDGKRTILNDVLSSHPSTQFSDIARGIEQLAAGQVGHDIYPVALSKLGTRKDLRFELKEIEYETSYISNFEYAYLKLPHRTAVGSDHQVLFSYDQVQPLTSGIVHSLKNSDVTKQLTDNLTRPADSMQPRAHSINLEPSNYLEFTVPRAATGPTYIYLESFWRDIIGKLEMQHQLAKAYATKKSALVASPYAKYVKRATAYLTALTVAVFGNFWQLSIDDTSLLTISQATPTAHASYPPDHSLHAQYRTAAGAWQEFTVTHPRFALSHPTLIAVPEEAFGNGQDAQIRLVATAEHCIYALGIATGVAEVATPAFTSVSGINSLSDEMHVCTPDNLLKTAPGSHYGFTLPAPNAEATHVVFKLHGVYTPLTPTSAHEVRQWWSALSTNEQALYQS